MIRFYFLRYSVRSTLSAVLLWPVLVFGQEEKELRPVTRTYAITNATVIPSPGRKIEHGTVVIKDGLILSVGSSGTPPPDAIVIKGDSLFIYAGFIDGLSRTGVTRPKDEPVRERPKEPGNPTYERAGITPQTDVVPLLSVSEKSIEEMRAVGFTVAQIVPNGNMLPGNGAIILLGGNSIPKMILAGNSCLFAELSPTQGAYPSTVIGVMAKFRELYRQASSGLAYESTYASNRNGIERPVTNRVLQAFYPVIEKKQPILFKAEKILDVYRVFALQADLGFPLILGNLKEGWTVADKIKSSGTRVFLSLDLPEDKKDDDKKDDDKKGGDKGNKKDKEKKDVEKKSDEKADEKKDVKKDTVVKVKTRADLEKDALEKRKAEFVAKYNGQAVAFQKAGIHFGFSALTVKSKDVMGNIRKIVAAGLSEDEALAALTTYPAEILNMSDRLGSIDKGKMANLVITDKSYFNEKANVRYVFVDGELYKLDVKDTKKTNDAAKMDISGSWTFSTDTPQGKNDSKIVFKKNGDAWSATVAGNYIAQTTEAKGIEVASGHLKFSFQITIDSNNIDVTVDGKLDADSFTGTSTAGQFGSFPTTGKKDPKF